MKPLRRGSRCHLKIERLAIGGRGVARLDGLVIFVADVAPGDEVEAEVTLLKKNFAEARLVRVVTPGPSRVSPPCPVAGTCGGCSWQQVAYDEQLRQKRALVHESLRKFSRIEVPDHLVEPTVASPLPFRYRNRIQLHHSGPKIGYFQRGSHDIVDIDDCLITEEPLAVEIPRLKRELAHRKAGRIEIFRDETGKTAFRGLGSEDDGGAAFAQVNSGQNENLVCAVVEAFAREAPTVIVDLYAGSGNFTFPLAKALPSSRITAVELNPDAVRRGQSMAAGFKHVLFEHAPVEDWLKSASIGENTGVLLDPPRTGCGTEVVSEIARRKPALIAYVSCHPVTLARDLSALSGGEYEISSVRPFDMFPQTDHVEVFALLKRRSR